MPVSVTEVEKRHALEIIDPLVAQDKPQSRSLVSALADDPMPPPRKGPVNADRYQGQHIANRVANAPPQLRQLWDSVSEFLTGLGDDVQVKELKFYVAFKRIKNFVCLELYPQAGTVVAYAKLDPTTAVLESGFSRDVKKIGHFGTGDLEISMKSVEDFIKAHTAGAHYRVIPSLGFPFFCWRKQSSIHCKRLRGDILDWRDKWASKPRSADMAMQVLSQLLSWAVDRGRLEKNHAKGIGQLYESDRSDIIWTPEDFEAFYAKASVEVQEGVELASCTGLRRADLVALPWESVGEHALIWQTSKSRGRNRIVVPLLPETKALLGRIKARHETAMAALPEPKRRDLPTTILANSRWKSWTPMGFGSRFNDAKQESGVAVNLHDLRGTFATRCMIAGLTDQEIADILGWSTKDIAGIRVKYVDQARVVVALAERISRSTVNQL